MKGNMCNWYVDSKCLNRLMAHDNNERNWDRHQTSEYDVYGRQLLTYLICPRAKWANVFYTIVVNYIRLVNISCGCQKKE